jgi:hypothetical protein
VTWATISAGINATVAGHCGEVSTLVVSGVPYQVHAVVVSEPTPIGDTDAWESVPTAQVPAPEVPYAPRAGDPFTDALGLGWIVDRADLSEGMWSLTLRKDPAA